MAVLAATPRVRSVDPTLYTPLRGFSCGDATHYEREVNRVVAALHAGGCPGVAVRVAEDAASGDFFGLYGVQQRPLVLPPPYMPISDTAYIGVIGLSRTCRGKYRLPDGTRLGDFLLEDALDQIRMAWGGNVMPPVWALIDPDNMASQNIFRDHHFQHVPPDPPGGHQVWYRPRGVPSHY